MEEDWTEQEFISLYMGDTRLTERAKIILKSFEKTPGASFSQAFNSWGEIKACYRFCSNDRVRPEKILSAHLDATIKRIREHPIVLMPTDTTSGDYTSKSVEGLGRLSSNQHGDNFGIFIHPTLAITPERLNLGVVGAKIWTRDLKKSKLSKSQKKKRPIEEKEIYRWIESYNFVCSVSERAPNTKIINITDREGDFTDLFAEVLKKKQENPNNPDIIVRSCQDRVLLEEEENKENKKLRSVLKSSAKLGEIEFNLPESSNRKQRLVKQTIRAKTITFRGTLNRKIKINAVMAVEENPPEGEKPLIWVFLTTLPIGTWEEIIKVIDYYLCRWEIEIFHKILKSGFKIEERQLKTASRLENLIALYLILTWRVQHLMMLGRTCPNLSADKIFAESEWKSVVKILNKDQPIPSDPPTLNEFIKMIGKLGGYIGRNNDLPPGPKVMWKGLSRMYDFAIAWEAFVGSGKRM